MSFLSFCSNFDVNEVEELLFSGNVRDVLQTFIDVLIIIATDLENGLHHYHGPFEK